MRKSRFEWFLEKWVFGLFKPEYFKNAEERLNALLMVFAVFLRKGGG